MPRLGNCFDRSLRSSLGLIAAHPRGFPTHQKPGFAPFFPDVNEQQRTLLEQLVLARFDGGIVVLLE